MPTLETMKTPPNAGTPCLKGAGNYDDPDCPGTDCYRAWQETSRALFREFLNQNPHLATARPLRTMHCLEQLTTGSRGRHKGIAGVCQEPLRQSAFDHWAAVQTEDRQVLVLSHPYGGPEFTELRLPDPATITQDSYGLFRIPRDTREGGPDYPRILGARSWGQRRVQRIKDLQALAVRDGGIGRSWYLPGRTYLTVIGRRAALASINLDYPVAVPECAPRSMRRVRSMDFRPVAEGECVNCPGPGLRGPQARRQPAEMVGRTYGP